MPSTKIKYYFTFGQSHTHPETGELMKDYWVEISASDCDQAREIMFNNFGKKWSIQYDETRFIPKYFKKGCYSVIE